MQIQTQMQIQIHMKVQIQSKIHNKSDQSHRWIRSLLMFKIAFSRRLQQNENKYVSVEIQIQMDTQQFLKFHRSLVGLHVGGLPSQKLCAKAKANQNTNTYTHKIKGKSNKI